MFAHLRASDCGFDELGQNSHKVGSEEVNKEEEFLRGQEEDTGWGGVFC